MRVVRLGPLAEQGVGLRRTTGFQPSCCTWSNTRAKFFSVSPMYFETTSDRSTLYTSRPVEAQKAGSQLYRLEGLHFAEVTTNEILYVSVHNLWSPKHVYWCHAHA